MNKKYQSDHLLNLTPMKANIVIFQKIEKNKVFEALENNVSSLSELTRYIPSFTTVKEINSRVEKNRKSIIREHSTIALVLPEHGFSIIRIAPHGKDGIEITRIVVHESYQGKCIGNFLMNTLFLFLIETLGYIPPIFLECTGYINFGNQIIGNPIQKQTKFFRKFGFRVTESKYYPDYVRMDYFQDKSLLDNELNEPIGFA
ncbi:MAG: N-acetyltransferase, partial [Crocinitomicaceae bacterium]|nr:N-acetyltransferase [Crocinitomicaceae bacterium]